MATIFRIFEHLWLIKGINAIKVVKADDTTLISDGYIFYVDFNNNTKLLSFIVPNIEPEVVNYDVAMTTVNRIKKQIEEMMDSNN